MLVRFTYLFVLDRNFEILILVVEVKNEWSYIYSPPHAFMV